MSFSVRSLAFRRAITPVRCQSRSAQIVNARFFQSRVEPRVVDKYREKLERKLKSEGVGSYNELKEVYKDKIKAVRKEAALSPEVDAVLKATSVAEATEQNVPFRPPPPPPPSTSGSPVAKAARELTRKPSGPPGVKSLASYVDVDKLVVHQDPKDIELIWRARFVESKSSLCAVMSNDTYQRMHDVARRNPMFILPLPREGQGVEMHLLQWTFPSETSSTIIFTSLAEYKLKGEFAQPHATLTHHLELSESKNIVLVQGQVVPDRGVTVDDVRLLVMNVQKFYGAIEGKESERRRQMLEMFSRGDESFKIESLIDEVERIA